MKLKLAMRLDQDSKEALTEQVEDILWCNISVSGITSGLVGVTDASEQIVNLIEHVLIENGQ